MEDPGGAKVDPVSIMASVARAGAGSGDKDGPLQRLLNPIAEEVGESWRRWYLERRGRETANIQRIINSAEDRRGREGYLPMRVVDSVMGAGAVCDDELMAEYFGGLLAASKSPSGRDDRAIPWCSLVSRMSTLQVRAHFIVYREMAHRVNDVEVDLATEAQKCGLVCNTEDFLASLTAGLELDESVSMSELLSHVIPGLSQNALIHEGVFGWDEPGPLGDKTASASLLGRRVEHPVVVLSPSFSGMELFSWALGEPSVGSDSFDDLADVEVHVEIPRPERCFLEKLTYLYGG